MARVFLSHAGPDKHVVRRLAKALRAAKHEPWIAEDEILVGESIPAAVERGLRQADFVVVCLSKTAAERGWIEAERDATLMQQLSERTARIHRDIKPANILLDADGCPKLTDFDLVGAADTTGGTRTGAFGTYRYAAPECLEKPQEATARADVYGLGMTAIFCLLGRELTMAQVGNRGAAVRRLRYSDQLKEVLRRAVETKPTKRFADAADLARALRGAMDAGVIGPPGAILRPGETGSSKLVDGHPIVAGPVEHQVGQGAGGASASPGVRADADEVGLDHEVARQQLQGPETGGAVASPGASGSPDQTALDATQPERPTTDAVMEREADPDHDIVALIERGERGAVLTCLMRRHGTAVYRYCYEHLVDRTLADDVQQQIFIQAYRDLDRYTARSTLRTWLFAIARNRVHQLKEPETGGAVASPDASGSPHPAAFDALQSERPTTDAAMDREADPDQDIVALIQRGERAAALTCLMRRHGFAVYCYCYEHLVDRTLADDVQQQTFIQAHRDLDRFAARSTLRTWLLAIARHRVLDAAKSLRRAAKSLRRAQASIQEFVTPNTFDPGPPPGDQLDKARLQRTLIECMRKLGEHVRGALVLHYQQGLTFDDLGAIFDEKPQVLKARVSRALPALRSCIEAQLADCTGGFEDAEVERKS